MAKIELVSCEDLINYPRGNEDVAMAHLDDAYSKVR